MYTESTTGAKNTLNAGAQPDKPTTVHTYMNITAMFSDCQSNLTQTCNVFIHTAGVGDKESKGGEMTARV